MPLPDVNLDNLNFQADLVDEARKRIVRYCPEWTNYNLSDPGITLIELFAWMTEIIVYKLNKVPEKNYVRFLEMLGVKLEPAQSARVRLLFRLSAAFPLSATDETRAVVPQGLEVATQEGPNSPAVIFTTDETLYIVPPHVTDLRGLEEFNRNHLLAVGAFQAFRNDPPQQGAAFYIGLDADDVLKGHILRLNFTCERTEAYGVSREDPPLVWEVSTGGGGWVEIVPSKNEGERDSTGGLNNASGSITFYLPDTAQADFLQGVNRTWIRCRFERRREDQGVYSQSPRIVSVSAQSLGAATWATHAIYRDPELLGVSSGDAGQVYHLQQAPILALRAGETLEVEEVHEGELVFVPWQEVQSFAHSTEMDRHFTIDTSTGEISLGPAIRQPNGKVKQYGRVPQVGRRLRISRYRHGGGAIGNVPALRLRVMRSGVPYIDRVYNAEPAREGMDAETLDEAKLRMRREFRAQERAVTAEDFESLALKVGGVARARCMTPGSSAGRLPPGMLELLLVPAVHDLVAMGNHAALALTPALTTAAQAFLDDYRLLTTTLNLRAPTYVGVKVHVRVVTNAVTPPDVASARVQEALRRYIAPLPPLQGEMLLPDPDDTPRWEGWPFGKPLYVAELYALVQRVRGVRHVLDVTISSRLIEPSLETGASPSLGPLEAYAASVAAGRPGSAQGGVQALVPVTGNVLAIGQDAILCSLDHEVEVVAL